MSQRRLEYLRSDGGSISSKAMKLYVSFMNVFCARVHAFCFLCCHSDPLHSSSERLSCWKRKKSELDYNVSRVYFRGPGGAFAPPWD